MVFDLCTFWQMVALDNAVPHTVTCSDTLLSWCLLLSSEVERRRPRNIPLALFGKHLNYSAFTVRHCTDFGRGPTGDWKPIRKNGINLRAS